MTNPSADAARSLVVVHEPAGASVGESRRDRLADVNLIGDVVPAGRIGKAVDQAISFGFDVRPIGHT